MFLVFLFTQKESAVVIVVHCAIIVHDNNKKLKLPNKIFKK